MPVPTPTIVLHKDGREHKPGEHSDEACLVSARSNVTHGCLVGAHGSPGEGLVAHDLLHLRLVLLDAELGVLLLEVLHDLGHAALAFALELPAPCELDAAPPARVLLIAGKPLNESIVQYGPFVMNTQEEIFQAVRDFQAGKFA